MKTMLARSIVLTGMITAMLCACAALDEALAQSCNFSITNMVFGSVDVTTGSAADTTATFSVSCTGPPLTTVRVCSSLGAGSGGATNAASRFMASGANTLRYSFFTDASRSTVWGSYVWAGAGANGVTIDIPLGLGGSGNATRTVYGRVYSSQQSVAAASYISSFSGADAEIVYSLSLLSCNLLTTTRTTTFTVTADVPPTCRVATADLDFGIAGILGASKDGSTILSATCTSGTAYIVGLNGGLSGATDPTQRKMTLGPQFVLYGLYRDPGRTQPFGDSIGVNTLAGTGSGIAQTVPVYGRVPPQTTPSPGTYADTIVVTLTY